MILPDTYRQSFQGGSVLKCGDNAYICGDITDIVVKLDFHPKIMQDYAKQSALRQ